MIITKIKNIFNNLRSEVDREVEYTKDEVDLRSHLDQLICEACGSLLQALKDEGIAEEKRKKYFNQI